jgi:glycosyltransferase involved in cell wall biosynthesis
LNILVVHNFYQQPGGEDQVFAEECQLLRTRGHSVTTFTIHNDSVSEMGKLALAGKTFWNSDTYRQLNEIVRRERVEIAHFHNTFPLISPAGYYAARDAGARVVQTLHNYRLMCPAATFFRDGHVCEECLGRTPWPAVQHACYRDSRLASAVAAGMLTRHRMKGTYERAIDVYVALTSFARGKFLEAGFPASRIVVKPNFVDPDPGVGAGNGDYVAFVGRLSPEKGLGTLLKAWESVPAGAKLKILGDGPLREEVKHAASRLSGVEYLGRRPSSEVYAIVADAKALIFPSQWYEGLPRTIIESYATGTPVIASRLGSMSELVETGRTGMLFEPGNAIDLALRLAELLSDPEFPRRLRGGAREKYLRDYTAERNYPMLMEAYRQALVN